MSALFAGAAVIWAVACPVASAAEGRVDGSCDKYGDCWDTVFYVAAPTERLDVRLSQTASAIAIHDDANTPVAGSGCELTGPHDLECRATTASESDLKIVEVDGGQVGNTIDASGLGQPYLPELDIRGGRGADRIIGGSLGTVAGNFFPGGGHDSIDGGTAGGTVDFWGLRQRVDVDLERGVARGPNGLLDSLRRVESVVGSDGGGRLLGDAAANVLCGGRGRNVIEGRGGDDVLGSYGPARLVAGRGRSALGDCGTHDDPGPVPPAGQAAFECWGPADEVDLDGIGIPSRSDWTVGSRCTRLLGLATLSYSTPMRLVLDAGDPGRDRLVMPFDGYSAPRRFTATLRAADGTVLAAVARNASRPISTVVLRLSRSGGRYLLRRQPLAATLRLTASECRGGCKATSDVLGLRLG